MTPALRTKTISQSIRGTGSPPPGTRAVCWSLSRRSRHGECRLLRPHVAARRVLDFRPSVSDAGPRSSRHQSRQHPARAQDRGNPGGALHETLSLPSSVSRRNDRRALRPGRAHRRQVRLQEDQSHDGAQSYDSKNKIYSKKTIKIFSKKPIFSKHIKIFKKTKQDLQTKNQDF